MKSLIQEKLAAQQDLSAVERFASRKEEGEHGMERFYRDLIPSGLPGLNEQYAFEVDLDKCSGCKACVTACHSLNGLDHQEAWRDVGIVIGEELEKPYIQTVTTACHHCVEPGCLEGCPVTAFEKDKQTGIVKHLDDQCIGCQYCTMKCPYDVPKFSERLGIVRKCDMCQDRLAVGEAPACVQACPHQAIAIRVVGVQDVLARSKPGDRLIPGAFDSSYTKPSTQYKSRKAIPQNATAADAHLLKLEHPHWPLIVMLTLTQLAAGTLLATAVAGVFSATFLQQTGFYLSAFAFVILNLGLGASTLHIGRPLGAWRFFLGLRTSWMSREILAFGVFAGAASAAVAACWFFPGTWIALSALAGSAFIGLVAVFTSVMIYADTRRPFWNFRYTARRFFGATLALGLTVLAIATAAAGYKLGTQIGSIGSIITLSVLFVMERRLLSCASEDEDHPVHYSAKVARKLLRKVTDAAEAVLLLSFLFKFMAMIGSGSVAPFLACASLIGSIGFLLLQRYIFFTAVKAPRMPGGV